MEEGGREKRIFLTLPFLPALFLYPFFLYLTFSPPPSLFGLPLLILPFFDFYPLPFLINPVRSPSPLFPSTHLLPATASSFRLVVQSHPKWVSRHSQQCQCLIDQAH